MSTKLRRWAAIGGTFLLLATMAVLIGLSKPQLLEPYSFSTAVYDRNGKLLHLGLSRDDKYRLRVKAAEIPPAMREMLLLYEDRYFYSHPGVNPLSVLRAIAQMLSGSRRQGASTLTMQLARIRWNLDTTTLSGKLWQMMRALQLEFFYSKEEILEGYFNLSPYGGNVEGIGAAALIYFQTRVEKLNAQQAAVLAVVPQNPGRRHPATEAGRSEIAAALKRLGHLWEKEHPGADSGFFYLPIASRKKLPQEALHLVREVAIGHSGEVYTTLNLNYQKLLEQQILSLLRDRAREGISNAAALLVDWQTMEVVALAGSADFFNKAIKGQVDGTKAQRSPGSVLKPFIYALALEQGLIHPLTMLKDVPRNYGLYTPENFDRSFYGLVSAEDALIYSRNIPAVDLLLGLKKNSFYELLSQSGVKNLRDAGYYGLALALGGAEVSPRELARLYAMLANRGQLRELKFIKDENVSNDKGEQLLTPEAAFLTLKMLEKNQPVDREKPFGSHSESKDYPLYWKTGTSYGFKDAWSAGIFGKWVLVVWVGNFDGQANPALVGRTAAAPLFFKIIRQLDRVEKTSRGPLSEAGLNLAQVTICKATGDIANLDCDKTVVSYFIPGVSAIKLSGISRRIPINVDNGLRACRHKPPQTKMEVYEFWPTDVLKAYAEAGVSIRRPPAFEENCADAEISVTGRAPQIVFPAQGSVFVLKPSDKGQLKVALKATLDSDAGRVYWFINNRLIRSSRAEEVIETEVGSGKIGITAVDDAGRSNSIVVTVREAGFN